MYNQPYFIDVPGIGNLNLEEIIVEDCCPIFFTLVSDNGQRYISVCCEFYEEQRWIIAPISYGNLVGLLTNKLSIKNAFLTQENEKCIIAHWSKDNPVLRYDEVASNELPDWDLPLDEMLEVEDGEFAEYIASLKHNNNFKNKLF